jgi:hypothetical protein
MKTLARSTDRLGRVTQPNDKPPQRGAHVRGSNQAPTADPTFVGRELDNRRMHHPAVIPGAMSRSERRGAEQTYDER